MERSAEVPQKAGQNRALSPTNSLAISWTRVAPSCGLSLPSFAGRVEAEASFRALKSELSIRPLFHQKEPRVKAHVLVAFLGYAWWVTLKHLL
jgi:hypothetical protein